MEIPLTINTDKTWLTIFKILTNELKDAALRPDFDDKMGLRYGSLMNDEEFIHFVTVYPKISIEFVEKYLKGADKMKIKCTKCHKIYNKNKKSFELHVKRLKIDPQDYIAIYRCRRCLTREFERPVPFDWDSISKFGDLPLEFIEKYQDKIGWEDISIYQKLPESFIEKYKDKVNWRYISIYQKLSEPFIEKYKNKVDWDYIPQYQKLSESFIEKHKGKMDWDCILEFQKLSDEFISKHINKITESIFNNPCYKKYPGPLKLLLKLKFNKIRRK